MLWSHHETKGASLVVGKTDLMTADDEESTNGREEDANNEKCRKDRPWCQNRLPGLQPLLFECGIYASVSKSMRWGPERRTGRPLPTTLLLFRRFSLRI